MKIKLTQTTQIPDEGWDPQDEHNQGKARPSATNYAGAELEVSEELGLQLVDSGHAISLEAAAEGEGR